MTKLSVSFAATAMAFLAATACQKDLERDAEDVVEAKQDVVEEQRKLEKDVREAQQDAHEDVREQREDLRGKKAEFAIEADEQLREIEKKYRMLDEQATSLTKTLDITAGVGAQIQQAHMLAKAKLEAARTADNPTDKATAVKDARAAVDELEERLDDYQDAV